MMKPALFLGLLTLALPACNKVGGGSGGPVKLDSDDQKTLYALGLIIGRNVANFNLSPSELETVKAGISDAALAKKPQVELEVYGPKVNQFGRKRSEAKAADEKNKGKEFADKAAQESGAERLTSGAVYKSTSPGTGAQPKDTDTVKVNYRGTLINGTEFDSSYKRNEPATFPLHNVIPCWTEGLQKMKVGEKARLVCPSNIAYGDQGRPPTIPGGATLVFEVELVDIVKAQTPVPGQGFVPPSGMKMAPGAHFGGLPPGAHPGPGGLHLPPPSGAKTAPAAK